MPKTPAAIRVSKSDENFFDIASKHLQKPVTVSISKSHPVYYGACSIMRGVLAGINDQAVTGDVEALSVGLHVELAPSGASSADTDEPSGERRVLFVSLADIEWVVFGAP